MITYELAKKLKDAGFPQGKSFYFYGSDETDTPCYTHDYNSYDTCNVYQIGIDDTTVIAPFPQYKKIRLADCPSLSELIEACGDKFGGLWRVVKNMEGETLYWRANDWDERGTEGQTPEEAVANLWLRIHKNDKENT